MLKHHVDLASVNNFPVMIINTTHRINLTYVVPEYQRKGVLAAQYANIFDEVKKRGIQRIELGTIMENNAPSYTSIESLGGKLEKVYRLYMKKLYKDKSKKPKRDKMCCTANFVPLLLSNFVILSNHIALLVLQI